MAQNNLEASRVLEVSAAKVREVAFELVKLHGIDTNTALLITTRIFLEAKRALLDLVKSYGSETWQSMTIEEKSLISSEVVKGLLSKERLNGFLNGKKPLVC